MDSCLRGTKLPSPQFRIAPIPEELQHVRGFHNLQTFFPTLNKLYRINKHQSDNVWLDSKYRVTAIDISGTSGSCQVCVVPNGSEGIAAAAGARVPAFLKVTHLLDPIRWMKGKYSLPKHSGLPWHNKTWTTASSKLQDPWNQAYVETIACYALGRLREEGLTPHFNTFYGAFCARADVYRYNVTDDFGSYRNMRWFWDGQKKGLYSLKVIDTEHPDTAVREEILDEFLTVPSFSEEDSEEEEGEEEEDTESEDTSSSGSDSECDESEEEDTDVIAEEEVVLGGASGMTPAIGEETTGDEIGFADDAPVQRLEKATGADTDDDSDSDVESESDIYRIYTEFNDFPVMLIAVEENEGTMDDLLEKPEEVGAFAGTPEWEGRWTAWLFQVVAGLIVAQEMLGFTHNDLHSNNIVWTRTEEEFLYYRTKTGAIFKVPTYGKLFRIIDFGRAIFRINEHIFISDDFRAGNDAEGQYCFKPLLSRMHPSQEVIGPNPSFDLCRLSVSLFDALFSEEPAKKEGGDVLSSEKGIVQHETVSSLFNMLWSWMIDDEGENVLIEPNGDERFPDFDLYKHIAAKVHTAVPAKQLTQAAFDQFQISSADLAAGSSVKVWPLFV